MGCQPTDETALLQIVVNGSERRVAAGLTVLELLRDLQLEPSRVAVELDRRIIKRAEWETRQLESGARLEIVQFVGGG
jgi:sulfur carrier protein